MYIFETRINGNLSMSFSSPQKGRKAKPVTRLDNLDKSVVHRGVNHFYVNYDEMNTYIDKTVQQDCLILGTL